MRGRVARRQQPRPANCKEDKSTAKARVAMNNPHFYQTAPLTDHNLIMRVSRVGMFPQASASGGTFRITP